LSKTWTGALEGTSQGVMLTAGDPASGSASYIATELFEGTLDGREGPVTPQQPGTMAGRGPEPRYVIAPGSGTGALAGPRGTLTSGTIHEDGRHDVAVELS